MFRKLEPNEMNRVSKEDTTKVLKHPIYLMLHNIRSMWNVGSMFRTSDAAQIKEVIITGYTAKPPRKEIDKTALGATNFVKWSYVKNALDAIDELKKKKITIASLEITTGSRCYDDVLPEHFPLCLIVGNEVSGIDDEILMKCDLSLEIPQYGVKHSLNVAVAAGIAIYELVRQWRRYS